MSTIRKHLLIGLTVMGLGMGSAIAYPGTSGGESRMGRAEFSEQKKERMEKRAAELRAKLNLNAEQEKAWNAYVAAMKPGERPARPNREELAKLTAPERMERMHARMKEGEQRMAARVAATKDFYAVLTPEQRKVFDADFPSGRPHHGRRHKADS